MRRGFGSETYFEAGYHKLKQRIIFYVPKGTDGFSTTALVDLIAFIKRRGDKTPDFLDLLAKQV
jgi:hypothetical protein